MIIQSSDWCEKERLREPARVRESDSLRILVLTMRYLILYMLAMTVMCWADGNEGHDDHDEVDDQDHDDDHDHDHGETFCDRRRAMNDTTCISYPYHCTGMAEAPCERKMSVQLTDDVFKFHLSGELIEGATSGWVALGFSEDTSMGDDDVIMCIRNDSEVITVHHRYNGEHDENKPSTELGADLILTDSSFIDNILSCSFNRTAIINNDKTFDLINKSWYLFFGVGPIISPTDEPTRHWMNPYVSYNKIRMSVGNPDDIKLKTVHGHDHDHDENRAALPMGGQFYIIGLVLLFQQLFLRT